MSAETEVMLDKVKRVKNIKNADNEFVQKSVRFMAPRERKAKQDDLAQIQDYLAPENRLPGHTMLDPDAMKNLVNYSRWVKKDLAEHSPPDKLDGETKDALSARLKYLEDEIIKPGLQETEIMRRNPPGAVSAYMEWDKRSKAAVLERRNIKHALEPDNDYDDFCSLDHLRPSKFVPGGTSMFDAQAQVTGHFAQSTKAKENWPAGLNEYAENSPLMIAMRKEIEELKAKLNEKEVKKETRRERSEEFKQRQKIRMQKYWEARRANKTKLLNDEV